MVGAGGCGPNLLIQRNRNSAVNAIFVYFPLELLVTENETMEFIFTGKD